MADAVTEVQFRSIYPQFQDLAEFTPDSIGFYLDLAAAQLNMARWGAAWRLGVMLYTAHYLALDQRDRQAAKNSKIVGGASSGILSSKTVGSVSASYDTASALDKGAGFWNSTTFGQRFWQMSRMAGMGGMQINGAPVGYARSSFRQGPI